MAGHLGKMVLLGILSYSLAENFHLTILHTSDVHARFEETDALGGPCSSDCFGGVARRHTVIQEIRESHENVLLLDAGDQFSGTLWYNYYQGNATKYFIKKLGYDVITLGNHEFDNGIQGLAAYLKDLMIPVVASNLDATAAPELASLFTASTVLNVAGRQVGVVGYLSELIPQLVKPDAIRGLNFKSVTDSLQAEIDRLKARGVNIIIGLGNAGYEHDLKIAREVSGLDLIVGGHSKTFLYNGDKPSTETPDGPYPAIVPLNGGTTVGFTQTKFEGDVVPIVYAYVNGKYLGYLNVTFNDDGKLMAWAGNPLLLNSNIEQDPTILAEVETWKAPLAVVRSAILGRSLVFFDGYSHHCRLQECNMGNMVTDAIINFYLKKLPGTKGWANVSVALWNSGAFVNSFQKGNITLGDVLQAFPYRNMVERVELKGSTLWSMLEHSISQNEPKGPSGRFLQFSGLKVAYDTTFSPGNRIQSVHVLCASCDVPKYSPLDETATYSVLMNEYLIQGGDKYDMIPKQMLGRLGFGDLVTDMISSYIQRYSPLKNGVVGRILIKNETDDMVTPTFPTAWESCSSATHVWCSIGTLVIGLVFAVSL